jgi:hypothetical protein
MKTMKAKNIFLALAGSILLVSSSCKKNFLDLSPYDQVPLEQAITDEAGMQAAVLGIYANLRSNNLYGRTLPLDGDLMADNVFISTSN